MVFVFCMYTFPFIAYTIWIVVQWIILRIPLPSYEDHKEAIYPVVYLTFSELCTDRKIHEKNIVLKINFGLGVLKINFDISLKI